jgi:UDP-N-acetylglucosamine 2-epimerase
VLRESARLLDDGAAYRAMTRQSNPFGDGSATPRILDRLHADLRVEPVLSLAG